MSNRSDTLDQLATALSLAQAEFTKIPKDSTNPFFKSKYAGLAAVVEKASPVLTKHGLAISQFIGADEEGRDTLTTWLLHKSGQFLSESMRLHLSKADAQGQGSATTYARRYSYMAVLGLVADEDDDGNRASQRQRESRQQPAAKANGELVTKEDKEALGHAAKWLKLSQIKMALAAEGIPLPDPCPASEVFALVPQAKAAALAGKLAGIKREGEHKVA